ncbi:YXWGXW repeat-containing protein [Henriciella mobilis]|uniref:YXWGXW repeat-containing protein n=1 Tax=Henriciella mobilis TaxID=2305467 RepID=A0A399RB54_9PROT|nr:YXWGXW repeat-containing protein [Henriciella mobilis]RIJ14813.1 hypothetical protein D1231_14400 [Henriciella mobilis]RIJ21769.1 hypothetical protein D1227_09540 [Henriciella mobilis]RIJ26992.1 hypothetical protein D1223_17455 [Henriciella mobilis]
MKRGRLSLLVAGACLVVLGGCAWGHHGYGPPGPGPGTHVVYIQKAPPPSRRVTIPPRPVSGAIWISGYWEWSGVEFRWVDGYWERNPPRGKRWTAGHWVETRNGWYWSPGRWH